MHKLSKKNIDLDIAKLVPNPGKRAVAKMCLNSLWGKFGRPSNLGNTEFVNDPIRFYNILLDDKLTDVHVTYINETLIHVNYKQEDVFVEENDNTNIFLAIFTSADARLRLYEILQKLPEAVVYCDIDLIVYIDNGLNTLKTGDLLSEWNDELGENVHIEKWLATGPKSYHCHTNTGEEVTKVKGFT